MCLWPLARVLRRQDFIVEIFSYSSVSVDLEMNARRLTNFLNRFDADAIHLVGHSLGGILIRALFHYHPDQKPGRIVTLGTPHQGCRVAQNLNRYRAWRWIMGRSVAQLLQGRPQTWRAPARDIGVISGNHSIGMGRLLYRGLPAPNDGLLTVAETSWANANAHRMLPVTHTGMIYARNVAEQVSYFLRTGRFVP